jgi:acyl-coenzyme A synthetase/AMP-(fatty) acid ligase
MPDVLAPWTQLVRQEPDALALVEAATARPWTRAELDASALQFPGLAPGQKVTFALPNGARWFSVFIGLIRAGAIPVPLDPAEPPASQRQLAVSAGAAFAWINDQLEPICHLISDKPVRRACLVKLTSGSTGQPKPLVFTHAQMLADGRQVCASMGITPDDLNFAVIPLGHSYGLGNLVMPLLMQGTALVCSGVPLPHVLVADIARWRPTVFPAVPALLHALAHSDLPANALSSLRTVISAGSPLSADVAQAFHKKFNLRPHGFYGSSETGGIAYDRTGEATHTGRAVGTPMDGVSITPARGGRIRVTSPAVRGRGSFVPADRVSLNEHGELVLHGRAGRLVKISGRRLDLGDLERVLRALPGVRDAFVILHPENPDQLATVLATDLDSAAVRTLLRSELASWKVPRRVATLSAFPLTARGKPDTRALQAVLDR